MTFEEKNRFIEGVLDVYPEVINVLKPYFQELITIKMKLKWAYEIQNSLLVNGLVKWKSNMDVTLKAFSFFSGNNIIIPDNVPFQVYGIPLRKSLELKEDEAYLTDDDF